MPLAVTADQHLVRMGLRHPGGYRTDADFGDQFHGNGRIGIGILQVEDELC